MKYKLINFAEIDKYAIQSYCRMHNVDIDKNLGDVTQIDTFSVENFNFLVGGSPCQDYSISGNKQGALYTCNNCGHKYNPLEQHYSKRDRCPNCNSDNIEITRSSLIVHYLRFLREKKPDIAIYENVKNLQNKEFRPQFEMFLKEIEEYGYNYYWKVLNSKNFGIPQNRERIYVVIIKKEKDNGQFKFPEGKDSGLRLRDICGENVDEKYLIRKDMSEDLIRQLISEGRLEEINPDSSNEIDKVGELTMKGKESIKRVYSLNGIAPTIDTMQGGYRQPKVLCWYDMPKALAVRGRYYKDENGKIVVRQHPEIQTEDYTNTLTTVQKDNYICTTVNGHIRYYAVRKITPRESFELMGFRTSTYEKARYMSNLEQKELDSKSRKYKTEKDENDNERAILLSDAQAYKQAGNSIVVNVLVAIYEELIKTYPELMNDVKLCSLFSGIGAFEEAFEIILEKQGEK